MRRGWLYSAEEPEGEIFEGAEYLAKVREGWVDSPAKIGQEPEELPYSEDPYKTDPYTDEAKPKNKGGRPRKVA